MRLSQQKAFGHYGDFWLIMAVCCTVGLAGCGCGRTEIDPEDTGPVVERAAETVPPPARGHETTAPPVGEADIEEFVGAAGRGDVAKVVELLNRGVSVDACNGRGDAALHKAAAANQVEVIRLLLREGADVMLPDIRGKSPLHRAGSREVAELLVAGGADVNAKSRDDEVPLHTVTDKGVVEYLLAQGADVDVRDDRGMTPLHKQARMGEGATALLTHGVRIDTWDSVGLTPLHDAAKRNQHEIIVKLLEKGARAEARNYEGRTPLHAAALANAKEAATSLIEKGAQINAKDHAGHTPLDVAMAEEQEEIVQILKANGGKPSDDVVPTGHGGELFRHVYYSAEQFKRLLAEEQGFHGRDGTGKTLLHEAAEEGNVPVLELLIARGLDPNAKCAEGYDPLHIAVLDGETEAAELLLAKGARLSVFTAAGLGRVADLQAMIEADASAVHHLDADANTPLHLAVLGGSQEAVELLVDRGAHLEARNRDYRTPLLLSAQLGQTEIVDFLLARGAKMSAVLTMRGPVGTALHLAAWGGHTSLVTLFLEKGMDVDVRSRAGTTPLWLACVECSGRPPEDKVKTAELLLAKGADVNASSRNGITPILQACTWSEDLVRLLLDRGARADVRTHGQRTALHVVNSKEVAELLIARGVDVNARDQNDETPLFNMMSHEKKGIAELLINNGADVNVKSSATGRYKGDTPLHRAARGGSDTIVKLLLDHGADPNATDSTGATPLDVANKRNKTLIKLLEKHSAK